MAFSIGVNNNKEKSAWEIKLSGEVDISNAHLLKQQLDSSLAEAMQNIEIDAESLSYIDSTGLGVIIGTYGAIKKEGLWVKVANPRPNIKKLLNISGLEKVLCQ
ncbi:MAG: STAS domain-containing protein [Clostridiales bacterium]|nr:STAS domain-containing protein [Clostridiales bacterium]